MVKRAEMRLSSRTTTCDDSVEDHHNPQYIFDDKPALDAATNNEPFGPVYFALTSNDSMAFDDL